MAYRALVGTVGPLQYGLPIDPKSTVSHYRSMKRTVVWLTDRQLRALAALSKKSLAPVSALVRHAVDEFLRRGRKPRRDLA